MVDPSSALQSLDDCVNYFHAGETPEKDWVIGTEHEKIAVYEDTFERVPYEGERGIAVLLERISKQGEWAPILEGSKIIGLKRGGASITLEPGGQFELSGAPLATIKETCAEFNSHVDQVKAISEDLGIVWLSLGVDPLHPVSDVPVMPKSRYQIMRDYLPTRGSLGLEMMHLSATVQANFDFSDEADMVAKVRTAMGCTPLVSALFANSPFSARGENGFVTKRLAIWADTDPDRCGLLPFVFDSGFGYERYTDWALDVPIFFLIRDGHYIPAGGLTFRGFMENGLEGHRALLSDWDMHLTTLFPEVRLKQIIEVRGADAVPRELTCALPAIWKGLLYDADALDQAWDLVSSFTFEERVQGQVSVARKGLGAELGGQPVKPLADQLLEIASGGLDRISTRRGIEGGEQNFIAPLRRILESGKSPGEVMLDRWRNEWNGSLERLISYARY